MAGEIPNLEVQAHGDRQGRCPNTSGRHGPRVVYGGGADPLAIQIPQNVLLKKLKAGRFQRQPALKVKKMYASSVVMCIMWSKTFQLTSI